MKILYDHQIFSSQKYGGISRYFTQIISHFPILVNTDVSIDYSNNVYLSELNGFGHIKRIYNPVDKFIFGIQFRGKGRLYNFMKQKYPNRDEDCETKNKKLSIEYLKKQNFDIFHPTYYDDYFLNYIGNKPFVLTIHDMIHEIYPELLNCPQLSDRKTTLAKKANHIIAVSENTKRDIIQILDIPEEKISVIYHASSLSKGKKTVINLPQKYFLYVGDRWGYKNFLFFARVIEPVIKQNNDIFVVCTGRKFEENENQILTHLNVKDNFVNIFIEENDLFEVYNKSIALIFPSYYEGFGIPILEAFEAGCPVILSNSSCFPEIAQDCALYFSPKDLTQMRSCIEQIVNNVFLKQSLIEKGKIRIQDFSWNNSANQTLDVYKRVLRNE